MNDRLVNKNWDEYPWVTKQNCIYCDSIFNISIFGESRTICKSKKCVYWFWRGEDPNAPRKQKTDKLDEDKILLEIESLISNFKQNIHSKDFINDLIVKTKLNHIMFNKYCRFDVDEFTRCTLSKLLYNKKTILDVDVVEFPEFCFYPVYGKTYTDTIKFFDYSKYNISRKDWLSKMGNYYSECVICSTVFCNFNFVNGEKLSRFCTKKCYNTSLTSEFCGELHPNINTKEAREQMSVCMKEKIRTGEFTPTVTNSCAKSRTWVTVGDTKFPFRSAWDATFALANKSLIYEKIRIPYTINGKDRIYIVDFVDEENKILYEIKPNSEQYNDGYFAKTLAAEEYSTKNGYQFIIITNDWFYDYFESKKYLEDFCDQQERDSIMRRMKQFMKVRKL